MHDTSPVSGIHCTPHQEFSHSLTWYNFTYHILGVHLKWWVTLHCHNQLERESRKEKICQKDLILLQSDCIKRPLPSMIYQNLLNETRSFTLFPLPNIHVYKEQRYQKLQPYKRFLNMVWTSLPKEHQTS